MSSSFDRSAPPLPPVSTPVTETRFGVTTVDLFRRLEDLGDPEVQAWMKAQANRTRRILDAIPARGDVVRDLERLSRSAPSDLEHAAVLADGRLLLLRREAEADVSTLILREGVERGPERVIVDPDDWRTRTGKPHAVTYFTASPDGRAVLVGIAESGSELALVHVFDLSTGTPIDAPISRVWFRPCWLPDSSAFAYNRLVDLQPGQAVIERMLHSQAHLHRLGTDADRDPVVFGTRHDPSLGIAPAQMPHVVCSSTGAYMVGHPATVDRRLQLFVAPLAEIGRARITWRKLIDRDDQVRAFRLHADELYLLTSARAGLAIERIVLPDGPREVLIEGGHTPIDMFTVRADAVYYTVKADHGVGSRLRRLPTGRSDAHDIPLPDFDAVSFMDAHERAPYVLVAGTGWTRFRAVVRIDAEGRVYGTPLQPQPAGVDPSHIVATIVDVPSHDGVGVPLSIVHHRNVRRDGSHPALLRGYGSYGVSDDPCLLPEQMAHLTRGFVRAFCHARGGGEKGEQWYRAGFQRTKHNTWKDFNACAQYLVDQGYTSPDRLGAIGGSAGGILVGNAMIERPDLYRVVVPVVGALDLIGAALRSPNGPANWPEFGDPTTEEGYRALHAMSCYFKVADGVDYPAVMLAHGVEDPRVSVWQSNKMAARLQQASRSARPVLLRLDFEAGHGIGHTRSQRIREFADVISFMLWQAGVEGYQPIVPT